MIVTIEKVEKGWIVTKTNGLKYVFTDYKAMSYWLAVYLGEAIKANNTPYKIGVRYKNTGRPDLPDGAVITIWSNSGAVHTHQRVWRWNWQVSDLDFCIKEWELVSLPEEDDGWIEWGGGNRPVNSGAMVEVMYKNKHTEINKAGLLIWYHNGRDYDIIRYRVVK